MPTRWQTFPIKLEGGLTTNLGRLEQGLQAPGSATILQNFEADIQGGYTRILGFRKHTPLPIPGTGRSFGVVAINDQEVLTVREGIYRYFDGLVWTDKVPLPSTNIARIRSETYNFSGVTKTVVVDGLNPPVYFDHTTKNMAYAVGAPSDVVGANRVVIFKGHLFFTKEQVVSFSSPFKEDDFSVATGAGVINVGDTITGITVFRDQLIVFCLNRIFRIVGSSVSDFELRPITDNTGCLCGDTVQEVGGDIMYLGPDGIRYLSASDRDNDFGLTRASEKIQRKVTEIVNANCIYSSVTISRKNQYRLFYYISNIVPSAARGFIGTKFSQQTSENISWSETKGIQVYGISKYQARDLETIFFVNDTDFVYRMEETSSFDGEDIEAIFETPYMPITDPKIRKTIYKHTLYARPRGTFELTGRLKFDYQQPTSAPTNPFTIAGDSGIALYGDMSTIYGNAVYGSAGEEQYFNNVVGSGFVVAVNYRDVSQRPSFNINFIILEFRENERR